jgi:signal transduction histidine kinase
MVTITIAYASDGLTVRVADTGVGPGQSPVEPAEGNGLAGMRERAAALGGRLHTQAGPGGAGFVVEAFLPTAGKDDQ